MARSIAVWACGALLFVGATWCDAYGPRRAVGVFPPPPERVRDWPNPDLTASGRQIVFLHAPLTFNSAAAEAVMEPFIEDLRRDEPMRPVRFTRVAMFDFWEEEPEYRDADRFFRAVMTAPADGAWEPLSFGYKSGGGIVWLVDGRPVATMHCAGFPEDGSDPVEALLVKSRSVFRDAPTAEPDGSQVAP